MKLTKRQREVIEKMRIGWELGLYQGFNAHFQLQKGGLGRGGEGMRIHANTADSLLTKGYIKMVKTGWPIDCYDLTEKGKSA